ncbi:hypothetical protein Q9L58_000371 [Maublancomyces gigas]|uniref:Uncharacterized protein n=1 Tax=Discina gigas TaxID=1032678 RepID=A0ABR3GX01_9PEZI
MEPDTANRPSADKYLHETPLEKWGIVDYLDSYPTLPFNDLCSSWVKALSSLGDSAQSDKREKAASLLKGYKEGNDGHLAREWRDRLKVSPGSVLIQNSFNNSSIQLNGLPGLVTSSSDFARPPQKRTNKKKRKRCSDTQGNDPKISFIARFSECYRAMSDDRKWRIPSGVFLEDILYERFKDQQVELAVHSWVVDTCDSRVESCFDPDDWKAICDQIPPLPETDPLLVQSMRRFMDVSEWSIFFTGGPPLILPNVAAKSGRASGRCV